VRTSECGAHIQLPGDSARFNSHDGRGNPCSVQRGCLTGSNTLRLSLAILFRFDTCGPLTGTVSKAWSGLELFRYEDSHEQSWVGSNQLITQSKSSMDRKWFAFCDQRKIMPNVIAEKSVSRAPDVCMMDDTAGHWLFVTCPGCKEARI